MRLGHLFFEGGFLREVAVGTFDGAAALGIFFFFFLLSLLLEEGKSSHPEARGRNGIRQGQQQVRRSRVSVPARRAEPRNTVAKQQRRSRPAK